MRQKEIQNPDAQDSYGPFFDAKEKIVLVVEDDGTHRSYMEAILNDCGLSVVPAENGIVALTRLSSGQHFDLILMDWDMPEMDGLETVQTIRAIEAREGLPHIPVVAFTGNKRPGDREKCLAAGMDAYLSKEIWMPKWRKILIENLQGLIAGNFDLDDFEQRSIEHAEDSIQDAFDFDAFDFETLENSRKVLKKYFQITIEDYIEDAARYIQNIADGFEEGNAEKVAKNAHPLKSNSTSMGLTTVSEIAKVLERRAKESMENGHDLDDFVDLHSQILQAFQKGRVKLEAVLESQKR